MQNRRNLARPRRCARAAIVVVLGVAIATIAAAADTGPGAMAPVSTDVAYGSDPLQKLDLCRPPEPHAPARGVLLIHGGGWSAGDKADARGICKLAAARGLVGIAVNYRLLGRPAGPLWPAPLQDMQLAVRWVRAHATELGLDPERICAAGYSAGGHLAAFLAVLTAIAPGDQADQLATVSPRIACAVDVSGPIDLVLWPASAQFAPRMFGNLEPAALVDAEKRASPLYLVTAETAPMMVVSGTADTLVPAEQGAHLVAALRRGGVPAWLIEHPGGHVHAGLPQRQAAAAAGCRAPAAGA